jgi:hypothetical protein
MIRAETLGYAGNARSQLLDTQSGTAGRGRKARCRLPHHLLRVSRDETDPVMIILAAQIQLRRWRRSEPGQSPSRIRRRIREIAAARDALLMKETRLHAGNTPPGR